MRICVLLLALLGMVFADGCDDQCQSLQTIDFTATDAYLLQPTFINFVASTPERRLLDNICVTIFPIPDSPNTYEFIYSHVFCDGTNHIETYIVKDIAGGTNTESNPDQTVTDQVFAYVGCETVLAYRCTDYGDYDPPFVFGVSTLCRPITQYCLYEARQAISAAGLPCDQYFALPMNLPTQCVTERSCSVPPNPCCD